jgi:hypothetical protein
LSILPDFGRAVQWLLRPIIIAALIIVFRNAGFSEIIPSNRRIAWSREIVGVPGGIPNRTVIFADVTKKPYNADNKGLSDAASAIQNAINACPPNQVVYMPPGTYRINSPIKFGFRKGITLRGAGTNTVLVDRTAGGNGMINIGDDSIWQGMGSGTPITDGLEKGSTKLTVASASGLRTGMLVVINQANDPDLVWHPSEYPHDNNRSLQQVTRVTAVRGNTVTVWPPTYWTWNSALDPRLYYFGAHNQAEGDGCEDFDVDGRNGKSLSAIFIDQGYACWIKGVRSNVFSNHFMAEQSLCLEIRESVSWDAPAHGPNGSGIIFYSRVSSSLVEDNIIYRCFPGVEINNGSGGNVIAYNFMEDNYTDSGLMGVSFDCNHGAHTCMELYEGNVGSMFQSDGYYGSASHITLFRNRFHGTNPTLTLNSKCVDLDRWSQYFNVVGNVLGTGGVSVLYDPVDSFGHQTAVIYRLGFPHMGNNSWHDSRPPSTASDALDTRVRSTLIRHGNYDYVTKTTVWDPNITDHTSPASLYLTNKPPWFGALPWPPIGPDRTPMAGIIPAQARFLDIKNRSGSDVPAQLKVSSQ